MRYKLNKGHPINIIFCKHCHRIIGLNYTNGIYKCLDEREKSFENGRQTWIQHKCIDKYPSGRRHWIHRYWDDFWYIRFLDNGKPEIPEEMARKTGFRRLKKYASC